MPGSMDRWISRQPRWLRFCIGALPVALLTLVLVFAIGLSGPGAKLLDPIGAPAMVLAACLTALGGFLTNIAADRYLNWERRLVGPRAFFQNRDLALLVGRAIGMLLRGAAPDLPGSDAALVRRMAARAESEWPEIAAGDEARRFLATIGEGRLVGFLAHPSPAALSQAQTLALLALLNPDGTGRPPAFANPGTEPRLRRLLMERLREAVRQALKHDAGGLGQGQAAYAMQLDFAAALVRAARARPAPGSSSDPRDPDAGDPGYAEARDGLRGTLDELLARLQAQGIEVGEGIRTLADDLARVEPAIRAEGEASKRRDLVTHWRLALLAVLVACVGLLIWQQHSATRQDIENGQQDTAARLAAIETQLKEVLAPRQAGEDPTQRQLPAELIEKARELAERGNNEQQTVAAIALKRHAEADRLIQDLKRDPLAEAHRLLTLGGTTGTTPGSSTAPSSPTSRHWPYAATTRWL